MKKLTIQLNKSKLTSSYDAKTKDVDVSINFSLDRKGELIYDISYLNSSHYFVCSGYDSNISFHRNIGLILNHISTLEYIGDSSNKLEIDKGELTSVLHKLMNYVNLNDMDFFEHVDIKKSVCNLDNFKFQKKFHEIHGLEAEYKTYVKLAACFEASKEYFEIEDKEDAMLEYLLNNLYY